MLDHAERRCFPDLKHAYDDITTIQSAREIWPPAAIEKQAHKHGIGVETLVNVWLRQKLRELAPSH